MIDTTDLTKHYGDVTAVEELDLAVEHGDIHGFVGPNGAGKTTTMKMLVGLTSPTAGEVRIDGEPAGSTAAKRKLGYSPQDPALYESMTGRRYLHYMGKAAGMGSDVYDRADELLSWLDLADAADQPIGGYSGGMVRRLSLAQAMIHEPELLILDEPTAELDPSGRAAIIESLEDLTEEGMTVFVSSHVLAELEQFIDTVTILLDGELVETGSIEAVQEQYGGQTFAIESDDDAALVELLADQDWVASAERDDGAVVARTESPEEFQSELQSLMAEEGILLQGLRETGGLQQAFTDIVDANGSREDDAGRDAGDDGSGGTSDDAGRDGGDDGPRRTSDDAGGDGGVDGDASDGDDRDASDGGDPGRGDADPEVSDS